MVGRFRKVGPTLSALTVYSSVLIIGKSTLRLKGLPSEFQFHLHGNHAWAAIPA